MAHVADCIHNMEDLTKDDFKPEHIDFSDCVTNVEVQKLDTNGNPILNVQREKVTEWIKVTTNTTVYAIKKEQRKWNLKSKQEEYRKFEMDKKICLSTTELQFCSGTIDTLDTVPKYADIKKIGISLEH